MRTCALLVLLLLPAGASPAAGASVAAAPAPPRKEQAVDHRGDLEQVLTVVEHRTKNEKVLEKMREKLSALSDRELHLAASLCARITRADESAGSDIAFSIVLALVVLS
jgi:hypothetical protein